MSEHKTGLSNWAAEDKKLYWDRRNKGVRGQVGHVRYHQITTDEKGNETRIPVGKIGGGHSQFIQSSAWKSVNTQRQAHVQKQRKATSRGE